MSETLTFHVQFVASVGEVTSTTDARGSLVGAVQLIPTQGNCITPVAALTIAGVLGMDFRCAGPM